MVDGIGIALAPEPVRVWTECEPFAAGVDLDAAGMVKLAFAKHDVAKDEETTGRSVDRDLPLQCRIIAGCDSMDADRAVVAAVKPAAVVEADLEGRRYGQQPPAAAGIDEDAQAARAGDVVGVARDREELVEGRVADRQLSPE